MENSKNENFKDLIKNFQETLSYDALVKIANYKKTDEKPKQKCLLCNKPLKAFTATKDWDARKYHKSCFKKHNNIS